ncbi:MAG: hypothetical protein KF773_22010 [Deltaproteobacteria bacterium]|nr:hypothetical protein [Deltaproteobacteria bacterium]
MSPQLRELLDAVDSIDRATVLVRLRESPRRSAGVYVLATLLGTGTESVRCMIREMSRAGVPVDVIGGVAILTAEPPELDELAALYRDDLGGLAHLLSQLAIHRLREAAGSALPAWARSDRQPRD